MKQQHLFLIIAFGIITFAVKAKTFEFLNKLDTPIQFAIGSRAFPPTMNAMKYTLPAGKAFKQDVDNNRFPQLLFKDPKAPDVGFLYEFRDAKDANKPLDKNIYVRLTDEKGKISFEPQVRIVWPNLDKENIFLIGSKGISKTQFYESFWEAIKGNDIATVKRMLEGSSGPDVNTRDTTGATPLIVAAKNDYDMIAQLLIANGAQVNIPTNAGLTPLFYAVVYPNPKVVKLLIAAGADVNFRSKDGSTPLERARAVNNIAAVNLLKEAGAKDDSTKEKGEPQQPKPAPAPKPAPKFAEITEYDILGLKKGASDSEILGLTKEEIKNKDAVKKAFFKLSRIWHPDKIENNDVAKARYAQFKNEIDQLPEDEKTKLKSRVFDLIKNAYDRNR